MLPDIGRFWFTHLLPSRQGSPVGVYIKVHVCQLWCTVKRGPFTAKEQRSEPKLRLEEQGFDGHRRDGATSVVCYELQG